MRIFGLHTLSFIAPSATGFCARNFTAFSLRHLGQNVYRSEKRVRGWNVIGSTSHKPNSTAWIRYWEKGTGLLRSTCSYEDCMCTDPSALIGGHLWIPQNGPHIAPICRKCNHYKNLNRTQDANAFIRVNTTLIKTEYTQCMKDAKRK